MKKTECVKSGKDFRLCMRQEEETQECQQFRVAYMNCKRSGLDMRTRITGPKSY